MDTDKIRNTYKDQWITYVYGCGCSSQELVSDVLLLEVEPGWGCTQCDTARSKIMRVESIEIEDECNT